jgi:hypothetical protein
MQAVIRNTNLICRPQKRIAKALIFENSRTVNSESVEEDSQVESYGDGTACRGRPPPPLRISAQAIDSIDAASALTHLRRAELERRKRSGAIVRIVPGLGMIHRTLSIGSADGCPAKELDHRPPSRCSFDGLTRKSGSLQITKACSSVMKETLSQNNRGFFLSIA